MKIRLLLSVAAVCGASSLSAATRTWKGDWAPGPDWWNLGNNWTGGLPGAGDDAVLPASASFIGPLKNCNSMILSLTVLAPGYAFADNPDFTVPMSMMEGVTVTFAVTGLTAFDTPVQAGGSQTWAMNGNRGTIRWNEPVDLNAKTVTLSGTGIQEFNGTVTGAGNLIKTGTGRAEINSAMTGGGGINVQDGMMVFSHASMSKTVQMSAPGVVTGTGTVLSLSGSSGTVMPGFNGPGVLTVPGSLLLSGSAVLAVEIKGSAPGPGYDQLSVGSSVSLGGSTLSVTTGAGFTAVPGTVLTILNNTGSSAVTGTFAGKPEGASFASGNVTFAISYIGGTGNDVTLTVLSVASSGAERVWTGAVDNLWSKPGNWAGGVVPQLGDSVQFPEVDAAKKLPHNDLGTGYPIHTVRFTAGGYTLGGAGLTLSDGIVQQAPAGASENTVLLALVTPLGIPPAPQITRVRLQGGGPLTVTPLPTFFLTHAASELRLQNDQPSALLTCGAGLSGPGFLSSGGMGPVKLTSFSSHSGGVIVSGPLCQAAAPASLGTGPVTVTGGLSLGDAGGPGLSYNNPLHLSGTLSTAPGSGPLAWAGPVELQYGVDSRLTTAGGAMTFSGPVSGEGDLFLNGSNTVTFSGSAPNTWSGNVDISGIAVICAKTPGLTAIPGNIIVSGNTGALNTSFFGQLGSGAMLSVVQRASATFGDVQTLAALDLDSGIVNAGPGLTVTGSVTAAATLSPSEINGRLLTGASPVTWEVSGPASPGLRFSGSLGHNGGIAANVIKTGSGLLQVNDAPGSMHTSLFFTLTAGKLEWNDAADNPAEAFGPILTMNGGSLCGTGRVCEIVSIGGGQISPGISAGTFSATDLQIRENVTFLAEWIAGASDTLNAWHVQLNNAPLLLSGTRPPYGTAWTLINNLGTSPVSGQFGGLPEGGTLFTDGALLRITYAGGDGNDVVLTRITPPAPALKSFDITGAVPEAGGAVTAEGTGLPAFTYALEYSSDLTTWTTAVLTTADLSGAFHFEWTPDEAPPRRFFRISAR